MALVGTPTRPLRVDEKHVRGGEGLPEILFLIFLPRGHAMKRA